MFPIVSNDLCSYFRIHGIMYDSLELTNQWKACVKFILWNTGIDLYVMPYLCTVLLLYECMQHEKRRSLCGMRAQWHGLKISCSLQAYMLHVKLLLIFEKVVVDLGGRTLLEGSASQMARPWSFWSHLGLLNFLLLSLLLWCLSWPELGTPVSASSNAFYHTISSLCNHTPKTFFLI